MIELVAVALVCLIVGVVAGMMLSAYIVRKDREDAEDRGEGAYLER